MGRVKLKIKRLENTGGRQVTFSKRRAGIVKKATELSILCDIDLALLMFSPAGKPTLCLGENSSIEQVLLKFSQQTPQERAKRKLESLEVLKKTFKKLDHDVNIQEFLGSSTHSVDDMGNHLRLLQAQLQELHNRLSYWVDPETIDKIEHISGIEDYLRAALNDLDTQKELCDRINFANMEGSSSNQFQTGMQPMHMPQPQMPWIQNSAQHTMIPDATNHNIPLPALNNTFAPRPAQNDTHILHPAQNDTPHIPHRAQNDTPPDQKLHSLSRETSRYIDTSRFSDFFGMNTEDEIDTRQESTALNLNEMNQHSVNMQLGAGQHSYQGSTFNINTQVEKNIKNDPDGHLGEDQLEYNVRHIDQHYDY